ncbi:hypothetical protein JB92DRAFT_2923306 [Gautieria morchelliformis]|nr:hypothetical protein JB92DRAFT_2923306 [Gautieria morchelliformis]
MRCWLRETLLLKPFILIFISTGLELPAQTPHCPPRRPLSCPVWTSRSTCNILVKPLWRLHRQPFKQTCDEKAPTMSASQFPVLDWRTT